MNNKINWKSLEEHITKYVKASNLTINDYNAVMQRIKLSNSNNMDNKK